MGQDFNLLYGTQGVSEEGEKCLHLGGEGGNGGESIFQFPLGPLAQLYL